MSLTRRSRRWSCSSWRGCRWCGTRSALKSWSWREVGAVHGSAVQDMNSAISIDNEQGLLEQPLKHLLDTYDGGIIFCCGL